MNDQAADSLMKRIAVGITGWLDYQQATKASQMYSEYFVYKPIFDIAVGRGWKVIPQKALAKSKVGRGRRKTIDFAFYQGQSVAVLEVKLARPKMNHVIGVSGDVAKLGALIDSDLSLDGERPSKYILLIGQPDDLAQRCGKEKEPVREQLRELMKDPPPTSMGWRFTGIGYATWRFSSLVLREKDWWSGFRTKITGELTENEQAELDAHDLKKVTGKKK